MLTRRWFIGGACAAAAGFRYGALAGDVMGGRPMMKLGVLSDVHLNRPGECLFLASELPAGAKVHFEVRASECFGKKGPAISSREIALDGRV